jgi:hypothetical protein
VSAAAPPVQKIHVRSRLWARGARSASSLPARERNAQDAVGEDGDEDARGRVPEQRGVEEGEEEGPAGREEEEVRARVDGVVRLVVAGAVAGGEPGGDGELRRGERVCKEGREGGGPRRGRRG